MKEVFPNYNKNPTTKVFEGLDKPKKKIINDFLKYCEITSNHPATQKKIKIKLITFADILEKDLNKIDLEDTRLFLALLKGCDKSKDYKTDLLKQVKRFLIWKYEDYPKRFSRFDDFKRFTKGNKKKKLEAEDLFSADEINFIIKSVHSIKMKTLIAVIFESAARPEEILHLTFGKINFDKKTISVHSNKTGTSRLIPLNESISHLKRFKEEGFINATNEDYIFVNSKNPKEPLTSSALANQFDRIENNLKLKKRFYPYILRHSKLNFLRKKLSPDVYEAVSGHSLQVAMKFYKHLDKDAVIDEMNERIYEAKGLSSEDQAELEELKESYENQNKEITTMQNSLLDMKKLMGVLINSEGGSKLMNDSLIKTINEKEGKIIVKNVEDMNKYFNL